MKVVLDTNIVFSMIKPTSSCYWIRKAIEYELLTLCVTTDILDEYEEILGAKYGEAIATLFLDALTALPNVHYQLKSYYFRLIPVDQDDEKFADCAIASNVDYLVTNDKHFEVLKGIDFPIIQVVNDQEFALICKRRGILL
jgi:putative PIN family toxin of toxin-antitoxin system